MYIHTENKPKATTIYIFHLPWLYFNACKHST